MSEPIDTWRKVCTRKALCIACARRAPALAAESSVGACFPAHDRPRSSRFSLFPAERR